MEEATGQVPKISLEMLRGLPCWQPVKNGGLPSYKSGNWIQSTTWMSSEANSLRVTSWHLPSALWNPKQKIQLSLPGLLLSLNCEMINGCCFQQLSLWLFLHSNKCVNFVLDYFAFSEILCSYLNTWVNAKWSM